MQYLNRTQHNDLIEAEGDTLIGRRRLLWLAGGIVSSLLFSGCGSGGNNISPNPLPSGTTPILTPTPGTTPSPNATPTPSPTPDPIIFASADRLEPSGDLANQLNQFSESVDALSLSYSAPSQAMVDLESFLSSNRAVKTRQADPTANFQTMISAIQFTVPALHGAYERAANESLHLDQMAYLGDSVSRNNNLIGTAAVSNSLWVAAMMERNYHALNVLGSVIRVFQTTGLTTLADMVRAQTEPAQRLVAYAIASNVFNSWVDSVASYMQIQVLDEWKLDVSENVTSDSTIVQVNRMMPIALSLPLGVGYRGAAATSRAFDAQGFVSSILDNTATVIGAFADKLLVKQFGTGKYLYDADRARVLFQNGINSFTDSINGEFKAGILNDQINYFMETAFPGADGKTRSCILQIGLGSASLIKNVLATVGSSETIVGAFLYGSASVAGAFSLRFKIEECADPIGQVIAREMAGSAQRFDEINGTVTSVTDVVALTNPSRAECDQISFPATRRFAITPPPSNTNPAPTPASQTPSAHRKILAGTPPATGESPRSFANVQIAAAGLLLDHGSRNAGTVQGVANGSNVSFNASNFAVLIRREPGTTRAQVPAITAADLLCTSPGFLPMRSDVPKNLTSIMSLPELQPITTAIGTGVNFNVK